MAAASGTAGTGQLDVVAPYHLDPPNLLGTPPPAELPRGASCLDQPVLPATPRAADRATAGATVTQAGTVGDELSEDLAASAGTVARLGRRVQVRTAPADPSPRRTRPEGGPELTAAPGPDPDRPVLVVTVVSPTRLGWFTRTDWGGLLPVGGTLAAVSRSDSLGGWIVELTSAAGRGGLALLDRFVLLEVPLRDLDRPADTGPGRGPRPARAFRHPGALICLTSFLCLFLAP